MENQSNQNEETKPIELLLSPKKKNTKVLLIVILFILAFSLGIFFTVLYFTFIKVDTKTLNPNVQPLTYSQDTVSTSLTSTSSLTSSTSSLPIKVIYRDYNDKFITVKIPVASTIKVDSFDYKDGAKFDELNLEYRTFDLYLGNGFCMDTNCEGHYIDYDINDPLKLKWKFENVVSAEEGFETITRNGTYTLKNTPEKYLSDDGNFLFLYSDEFGNIDNKSIGKLVIFLKKDGKYKAMTSGGKPEFFNTFEGKNDYYHITPKVNSLEEFKTTTEVLLNIIKTFKVK